MRDIALILLGILLLTKTGLTVLILVQFLGIYFFVDGIFTIVKSIIGRRSIKGCGWGILIGILEVLAGIIVFSHPVASAILTVTVLVFVLAFMAMIWGFVSIFTGIRLRKEIKGEWTMILVGLFGVIFGVLFLLSHQVSAVALMWIFSIFAIVAGFVMVVASFKLKKFGKKGFSS